MTISKLIGGIILAAILTAAPGAMAKTYKLATVSPDGLSWMKKLRAGVNEIEELTDGRVKFKIYPGGVQGDDFTVLRKMRIGQLHGGAIAAGTLTRFYPDLQVYNLPLQFKNFEEVDFVRERMDQTIIDGLDDNGMVVFSLTETGFAYLLSKTPVTSVDDLKRLKAWVPEGDPISAQLIKSFGVSPIPLNLTDVLAGLQTGLINAVAVPPIVALALQWHNHVDYMMDIPLVYIYSLLALDKKAFDRMTEKDQATVSAVFNRVFEEVDRDNRVDNKKAYQALISQGIEVVTPGPEERPEWDAMARQSVAELLESGEISVEIVQQYLQVLAEFREEQAAEIGE